MNTHDNNPRDERLSDPAFEGLSGGDPAAATEPDLTVIKAKVDAAIAAPPTVAAGTAPEGTPGRVGDTAVVDLAAQRATRRAPRWLQVAAAAVGVVAVGSGAFLAGQHSSTGPVTADVPATSQEGGVVALAPAGPGTADGFSTARGTSSVQNAAAADYFTSFGRTVFVSAGLSDATSSGPAWGFDAAASFSAETAARLAAAFGVSGDPVLDYGSWHVGSADWTAAAVDLYSDGLTSFYFSDPALSPWAEGATTSAVTAEVATAALTDAMTALGVDPADYQITADAGQDPLVTTVSATPLVNGEQGDSAWSATVTTAGLADLNGTLATLVDLGTYDVVSPQVAVDRLGDARFGATRSFGADDDLAVEMARDMTVDPAGAADDPAALPTLPGAATPGASFAWPVSNVTIITAELGTGTYYQPDGSVALLPTYTLTGADGSGWTVVAVADAHLDFTSVG